MGHKLTAIFLGQQKIRPTGWQPGANTIAYYPLDSTNTVNDLSGNNRTLTSNGNVLFGTYGGVDSCYINIGQLTASLSPAITDDGFTLSIFYYEESSPQNDNGQLLCLCYNNDLGAPNGILRANGRPDPNEIGVIGYWSGIGPIYASTAYSTNLNSWNHYCYVSDNGMGYFYVNGVLYNSFSIDSVSRNLISISRSVSLNRSIIGYVSNAIIEDKVRTAQEISNYYNQTKGIYGL